MLRHKEKLKGVIPELVRLWEALERDGVHAVVVEGVRSVQRQEQLVKSGASRTMASKHLVQADGFSHATDVVPCDEKGRIDWNDRQKFKDFRALVLKKAKELGISVRHGADWDMNNIIDEEELKAYIKKVGRRPLVDYPHWEIVQKKKKV